MANPIMTKLVDSITQLSWEEVRHHALYSWTKLWKFNSAGRIKFYEKLLAALDGDIDPLDRIKQLRARLITSNDSLQLLFDQIVGAMEMGKPLSHALTGLAPETERLLVRAGEEHNNLQFALTELVGLMTRTAETKSLVYEALGEIALRMLMLISVIAYISFFVAPMMEDSLDRRNWTAATTIFFSVNNFIVSKGLYVAAAVSATLFFTWRRTPLFYIYKLTHSVYLLIALSAMVSSGMNLNDALRLANLTANKYVGTHIGRMISLLKSGKIEGAALDTGLLPKVVVNDLQDYSGLRGFNHALLTLGRDAHDFLNSVLRKTVAVIRGSVLVMIFGYILWVLYAIGSAAVVSLKLITY